MSNSFLYSYSEELSEKWREIDLLIERAKENRSTDSEFYEFLCRSITVLMVAQLEGFTKNLLRSVIQDLNRNLSYEQLPLAIKRTFCKSYIPNAEGIGDKKFNQRITKLMSKFDELNCDIEHEPFYISTNKNPSPHLLKTVFENLGVKNIFHCLNNSKYDVVFSCSKNELLELLNGLRVHSLEEVKEFPYAHVDDSCNLSTNKISGVTLWEEFISRVNQRRHSVAHGNESGNSADIEELEVDKWKLQIFELASMRVLAKYLI